MECIPQRDIPNLTFLEMNRTSEPAQLSHEQWGSEQLGADRPKSLTDVRLRKHADYQRAYAAARKHQSASMSWFLAPQQISGPYAPGGPRIGLTVGKVIGKAHERNRIKRRMREALRRHVDLLPVGFDLILHPRRSVLAVEFSRLETEVVRILEQAKTTARRTQGATAVTAGKHSPGNFSQ